MPLTKKKRQEAARKAARTRARKAEEASKGAGEALIPHSASAAGAVTVDEAVGDRKVTGDSLTEQAIRERPAVGDKDAPALHPTQNPILVEESVRSPLSERNIEAARSTTKASPQDADEEQKLAATQRRGPLVNQETRAAGPLHRKVYEEGERQFTESERH